MTCRGATEIVVIEVGITKIATASATKFRSCNVLRPPRSSVLDLLWSTHENQDHCQLHGEQGGLRQALAANSLRARSDAWPARRGRLGSDTRAKSRDAVGAR